jgi:hypothetical protein
MFGRFRFSSSLALGFGVAITTLAGSALGQTIVMSPTNPVVRSPARQSTTTDTTVALTLTRGDCKSDGESGHSKVEYTFNLNLTAYKKSYTLEVWAGPADCAAQYTNAGSLRDCWPLGVIEDVENNTASVTYLPKELFGVDTGKEKAILSTCDEPISSSARQSFGIYFLLTASNAVKASAKQELYYDLSGPAAPTDVSVGVAESSLKVSWTPVDDEGEITYKFYCAKATAGCSSSLNGSGGTSSAGGASSTTGTSGSSNKGGSTNGGASATSAGTGGLSSGGATKGGASNGGATKGGASTGGSSTTYPDAEECGVIRGRANEAGFTKTILENGTIYAVSVSAVDAYGNESVKSEPACGTPALVDTFFEHYRAEGGNAGGSYCSFGYGRRTLYSAGLLLLSLGAIASLRRRRAN